MKKIDLIKGLSLGVVLLLCSGAVYAADAVKTEAPATMPAQHGREKMMNDMDDKLGLTADQRTKMKTLRDEMRAKQESLREQVKEKRGALRQELDSTNPDRNKANALVNEITSIETQLAQNHVDQVFKVREILTPEQFQRMREFHEKNKGKHKGMGDRMKGERHEHGEDVK